MLTIFISYRRQESAGHSGRIYDRLRATLADADVFMDVESIDAGANWRRKLEERITQAAAILILIGPEWLTLTDAQGRRRLDDADDVTRWEIETALRLGKRIIPVLLQGVAPLRAADLPGPLAPLATLQAVEIRHESFEAGLETLIAKLTGKRLRDEAEVAKSRWLLERAKRWGVPCIALVVVLLAWVRVFDVLTLDTRIATWTLALADRLAPIALDASIVLVGIDGDHDPFDPQMRARYAALVTQLARARARSAVIDIHLQTERAADAMLAGAIQEARAQGTEVFASFVEMQGDRPRASAALAAAVSGMGLACAGRRLGYALTVPVAFEIRRTPEGWSANALPSLALLGAFGAVRVRTIDGAARTLSLGSGDAPGVSSGFSLLSAEIRGKQACAAIALGTQVAELMVRASPLETLRARRLDFDDVVAGRIAPERLAGKTVVIGYESADETFMLAHGLRREHRYGYELQADAINTLKARRITRLVDPFAQTIVSAVLAAFGAGLGIRLKKHSRSTRWAIMITLVLAYAGIAIAFAASEDILLNSVYDISALVFAYLMFRHFLKRRLP